LLVALGACVLRAGVVRPHLVVPLVPGYLSYLAALVGEEVAEQPGSGPVKSPAGDTGGESRDRRHCSSAGFTTVFVLGKPSPASE